MTEQPRVAELTDAEHVLHQLLGKFLHSVGWKPDDYIAAEGRQAMPWKHDPGFAVEGCTTLAGDASRSAAHPNAADLLDAEWVLHRVLREFLRRIDWKSDDYLAAEVRQAMPWERDPGLAVESCMTLAGDASRSTAHPNAADLLDAEWVLHRVLREFLRRIGWKSDDYLAAEVRQAMPWERDPGLAVESCMTLASGASGSGEAVDALVSLAFLLDQQGARVELVRAALPTWLINQSAAACLLLGRALLRSGEHNDAIATLLLGVAMDPTLGDIHRELGLAFRRQRRSGDAVRHFEMSLALPRRLQFDSKTTFLDYPVLLALTGSCFEIYFYQQRFYIVRQEPDTVGVRAIAGDLFAIKRNIWYQCARFLLRIPLMRALMVKIWGRQVSGERRPLSSNRQNAPNRLPWSSILRNWLSAALQLLALQTFARPIELRTSSLTEALQLAGEHPPASPFSEA